MVEKRISHYDILEKIGQGGMGEVYLAEDTRLHRRVALKMVPPGLAHDPETRRRLEREARAVAALNHPNIVTIYEVGEDMQQSFIAMEYVEGMTLSRRIRQSMESGAAGLPLEDFFEIAPQVCLALQAAHHRGVIHRDLKPENVLITAEGQVKVVDFGLAKVQDYSRLTRDDQVMGTIAYMSPEQAGGEDVAAASDIWSLGVMFYEMLSGALPFQGDYALATIYQILHDEPKPLGEINPQLPSALAQLVKACLEKEPDRRPQSAAEVQAALQDILAGTSRPAAPRQGKAIALFPRKYGVALAMVLLFVSLLVLADRNWPTAILAPPKNHLALLPFHNTSGDAGDQALCDGLLEILASKLSQIEQFQQNYWVVPVSEVRSKQIASAAEAHRWFGVNRVISGSFQRVDGRVRLTLNLIDAEHSRQLASAVLTEELQGIIDFQDKTALQLAELMNLPLDKRSRAALSVGHTRSPGALEFYLQGRGYLADFAKGPRTIDAAVGLFEKAIGIDSGFTLAYAGLGETYLRKYQETQDVQWVGKAEEYAKAAAARNPDLAEVQLILGMVYNSSGQHPLAREAFQKGIALDPLNANIYRELAKVYKDTGDTLAAEQTYLQAIRLKPDYWANYFSLGFFYFQQGKYPQAIEQFLHVTEVAPLNHKAYSNLGGLYQLTGQYDRALSALEKSLEIEPNYRGYNNLGALYFQQKQYEKAARNLRKALALNDQDYRVWASLAASYAEIPAQSDSSRTCFEKAVELAEAQLAINPGDDILGASLAKYHAALGKRAQARALIAQLDEGSRLGGEALYKIAEAAALLPDRELTRQYLIRLSGGGFSPDRIIQTVAFSDCLGEAEVRRIAEDSTE